MDRSGNLDRTDLALLRLLQTDSSLTYPELAEKLENSYAIVFDQATVGRKIKDLVKEGYILGFQAVLNREKIKLDQTILVLVQLENHREETLQAFEAAINTGFPNVIESMQSSGSWDYLLKIVGQDYKACDLVTIGIRRLPKVVRTREHAVKGEKTSVLPLPLVPTRPGQVIV